MLMFDTLNRHMLPPYGGDYVKAPNFERLAERSVVIGDHHLIVVATDTLQENPACAEAEPLIFFRGAFAA